MQDLRDSPNSLDRIFGLSSSPLLLNHETDRSPVGSVLLIRLIVQSRMKPRHIAGLTIVGCCLMSPSCAFLRESSSHVTGRALDKTTKQPVSDAQVTLTGFQPTNSAPSGSDGRFDLPRKTRWQFDILFGDPICLVTVRAVGYEDWSSGGVPCHSVVELGDIWLITRSNSN